MEKIKILLAVIFMTVIQPGVCAQEQASGTENDLRGRFSAGVDWKIIKGLHIEGAYEIRVTDDFSGIERHQMTIGVTYSPVRHLKIGGGYYFIGHYDDDRDFKPRHRFYADVTGSYSFGAWKFSLRERIQLTHNSYEFNEFQATPNLLELKSRLKVAYCGMVHLEPYAFVELRNCFNGPSCSAEYVESAGKWSGYEFEGYRDAYLNRTRGAIGLVWKIDRHHGIDFKLMGDWCRDKSIDTNAEGTKLKSYAWKKGFNGTIDIGYTFSF